MLKGRPIGACIADAKYSGFLLTLEAIELQLLELLDTRPSPASGAVAARTVFTEALDPDPPHAAGSVDPIT